MVCQAISENSGTTRVVMVRFGNVLAAAAAVIPKFANKIVRAGR